MQSWPTFDSELLIDDVIELPVQIMGKVRGKISVPLDLPDDEVQNIALNDQHISSLLEGLTIRKIIVVPNTIVNIVAN